MHSDAADLILRSDAIFTAARNELFSGYVVIKKRRYRGDDSEWGRYSNLER